MADRGAGVLDARDVGPVVEIEGASSLEAVLWSLTFSTTSCQCVIIVLAKGMKSITHKEHLKQSSFIALG